MEKLGLNLGFLIVQILNFAIIMVVLVAWVYKPLLSGMKKRRETIEQGLEDARIAADARANAEKDAGDILADAQGKAAQLIREATEKAEAANKDVRQAGEVEMEKVRKASLVEIEHERERALSDLRGHVSALAIAAAQKIIGETLDEKRQHALVDEFFSGIKSGKVVILEGIDLIGVNAEVTSALPLTDAERQTVTSEVFGKLGSEVKVTFSVRPEILGGLVLRVGDKIVDGSIASQVQNLRQSLN
ncbi:MAG: F-type H+-transporting ATPase subunit b [Chloroflexi bacterium]|nr:MAG: F-type H+-transporting ATPase subunit b [Chloroflexota bacterium]